MAGKMLSLNLKDNLRVQLNKKNRILWSNLTTTVNIIQQHIPGIYSLCLNTETILKLKKKTCKIIIFSYTDKGTLQFVKIDATWFKTPHF